MNTNKICFYGELTKIISELSSDTPRTSKNYPRIVIKYSVLKKDYLIIILG